MAYLRSKHRGNRAYHYLVKGIRNADGKVRQKVLKYYGTNAPGREELKADILELGTTTQAFDINARITKASLKAIIGTVWRNNYTYDLAKITVIHRNPDRGDFEVYDGMEAVEDPGLRSPLAWVRYGEKWSNAMEHWHQVDHLTRPGKLQGYRKRVGYCKEQVTESRKAYHDMKNMPQAVRGGCHTGTTRMRKDDWETAKQDLDEAVRLLEVFVGGGHNKVAMSG